MKDACAILYFICGLSGSTILYQIITETVRFSDKKVPEHKLRGFLIFSTTFVWNISHYKKKSARYYHKYALRLHVKHQLFCQILIKFELSWQIFENPQISTLMKIRPVGAELFHVDGQTDNTLGKQQPLFAILRTRLKTDGAVSAYQEQPFIVYKCYR